MNFLSVRDFRSSSREIWQKLSQDGKIVITNNGKPAALLFDLTNDDFEETLDTLRQIEDMKLLRRMRSHAEQRGFLSENEIEMEIQAARAERNTRKEAV